MAFETSVSLKDCKYTYSLHPNVKKYTLRDNTFAVTKVGNYELNRLLEAVPNSGEGFLLKIIFNKDLTGFKINITDKSGLRLVNIFKNPENDIIQQKFYFLMDSLVEREIFNKTEAYYGNPNLYRCLPSRTNDYLSRPCSLYSSFFRLCNLA